MSKTRSLYLALITMLFSPMAANADIILTGSWQGSWADIGATAVFDMQINQSADGSVTGSFDWTCTSGFTCSGVELFAGSFDAVTRALTFATTALITPYSNLGFATYAATVSADGYSIVSNDGTYSATKVPEPGTLMLLGLGLFGIGLARRRQNV